MDKTNVCLSACPSGEFAKLAILPSGHWPLAHLANGPIWPINPAFGVAPVPHTQAALKQPLNAPQTGYARTGSLQIGE